MLCLSCEFELFNLQYSRLVPDLFDNMIQLQL